ncbi:MAG: choice-of-anchor L domain-containing protein [Pseudomonadota bacterium]
MPTAPSNFGLILTDTDASPAIPYVLSSNSGISVNTIQFTGNLNALRLLDDPTVITGPNGGFTIPAGIFLTTGGSPGTSNTVEDFSVSNSAAGDADLDATALQAFTGAGSTQDAAILEFTFDTPAAGSLSFEVAVGSDEFPEFSNTEFVDIAAVYVNGVNYALFDNDEQQPLSIIDRNLNLGNFVDNTGGTYGIEYDGFAPSLVIFAPVVAGTNTVKVAIADTGDQIYDSGLFLSNVQLGGSAAQGTFVPVEGSPQSDNIIGTVAPEAFTLGDGDDTVAPGLGDDSIDIGGGANTIVGSLADLNGDVVLNFGDDDTIKFDGVFLSEDDLTVEMGSAILTVDGNGDGIGDATTTLLGEYSSAEFQLVQTSTGTDLSLIFQDLDAGVLQDGLVALYQAVFDRAPDGPGYDFWNGFLTSGELTLPRIADFFVISPEFVSKFGAAGTDLAVSDLVDIGYQNVLGRDPDFAGGQFWSNQLLVGNINEGDFFAFLATSEEFRAEAQSESEIDQQNFIDTATESDDMNVIGVGGDTSFDV